MVPSKSYELLALIACVALSSQYCLLLQIKRFVTSDCNNNTYTFRALFYLFRAAWRKRSNLVEPPIHLAEVYASNRLVTIEQSLLLNGGL